MRGADLRKAHLEGADLREAHLEGADLREAHLDGANLREAHLDGANFEGASLEGANFEGASLEGAKLNRANLMGATGLTQKQVNSAYGNEATTLSGDIGMAFARGLPDLTRPLHWSKESASSLSDMPENGKQQP